MFDVGDNSLTENQSLSLQSKVIEFVRDALVYDRGYMVFSVRDTEAFEFKSFYSDGTQIDAEYSETRQETIDRILFTINCKDFYEKRGTIDVNLVIRHIYHYVVGVLSLNVLYDSFEIKDASSIFRSDYHV